MSGECNVCNSTDHVESYHEGYEVVKIFNIFRPSMNDIQLWELHDIICDSIRERQAELRNLNVKGSDWRLKTVHRNETIEECAEYLDERARPDSAILLRQLKEKP